LRTSQERSPDTRASFTASAFRVKSVTRWSCMRASRPDGFDLVSRDSRLVSPRKLQNKKPKRGEGDHRAKSTSARVTTRRELVRVSLTSKRAKAADQCLVQVQMSRMIQRR